MVDEEIVHVAHDASTGNTAKFVIELDHYGLIINLPNGQVLSFIVDGGKLDIYNAFGPYDSTHSKVLTVGLD